MTEPNNRSVEYIIQSDGVIFLPFHNNSKSAIITCFPEKKEGIKSINIYLLNDLNVINEETFEVSIRAK